MEGSEHDEAVAGELPAPIPRWWAMPYPNEPLYPVDFFVAAKGSRRRRGRSQASHAPTGDTTSS